MNWILLQTLRGSFSRVSTPIFASKYSLELAICSKRRLRKGTWGETEKWKFGQMTVAITYIFRKLLFNIAQLSTARQEQFWRHFSLGATLAFFVFCVPLSPERAFWRRPGAAPLASFLESSWRDLQDLHVFAPLRPKYSNKISSNFYAFFVNFLQNLVIHFSSDFHWVLLRFSWKILGISTDILENVEHNDSWIFWISDEF